MEQPLLPALAIVSALTNSIENMMGTVRRVCRNVKRWRNAAMALRWTAAGMMEAAKGFRRLKAISTCPFSELHLQHINPSTSPNELNTTLTPHSMIHGDACFAYFNKIWGIPPLRRHRLEDPLRSQTPHLIARMPIGGPVLVRVSVRKELITSGA